MKTNHSALSAVDLPDDRMVAEFLKRQPDFFLRNRELIGALDIPHRADGIASLIEYQVTALREHNQSLQSRLQNLTDIAEQNQNLSQRVHRLALTLLGEHEPVAAMDSVYEVLGTEFQAEKVVLRLFVDDPEGIVPQPRPEFAQAELSRLFAAEFAVGKALCGPLSQSQNDFLFLDQPHEGNVALLPLMAQRQFGVLVLASRDPQRFRPDSGTMFLEKLADIIGSALFHCLQPPH